MAGQRVAGLVAMMILAGPAAAGDLPTFVGMPAPGIARCGAGGLVLSGTSTCLRLGGAAWADLTLARSTPRVGPGLMLPARPSSLSSVTALRPRAYLSVDTRTPTALGEVRTYVSVRAR